VYIQRQAVPLRVQRKEDMRGLQDKHALTLAGQHRQNDTVGGQEEGGRQRAALKKKRFQNICQHWHGISQSSHPALYHNPPSTRTTQPAPPIRTAHAGHGPVLTCCRCPVWAVPVPLLPLPPSSMAAAAATQCPHIHDVLYTLISEVLGIAEWVNYGEAQRRRARWANAVFL
jgi:hypothetical protein